MCMGGLELDLAARLELAAQIEQHLGDLGPVGEVALHAREDATVLPEDTVVSGAALRVALGDHLDRAQRPVLVLRLHGRRVAAATGPSAASLIALRERTARTKRRPIRFRGMARREYPNVLELVGATPIVRLDRIGRDVPGELLAKLEYLNPGGSVKDRIGLSMIEAAEGDRPAPSRRDDRRADLGQHRRRPRYRGRAARLPLHLRHARQDEPGEDLDAARVRGRGRHHAHRRRPALARRATTRSPTGSPKRSRAASSPTSTRTRRTRRPTTRPLAPRSGSRRTAGRWTRS